MIHYTLFEYVFVDMIGGGVGSLIGSKMGGTVGRLATPWVGPEAMLIGEVLGAVIGREIGEDIAQDYWDANLALDEPIAAIASMTPAHYPQKPYHYSALI